MKNVIFVLGCCLFVLASCQQATINMPLPQQDVYIGSDGIKTDYTVIQPSVGLALTAAIAYEADKETIQKIEDSLEAFSQLLWQDTFGQMYIKTVVLRNNSQNGYIHFEKLTELGGHAIFGGPFTVNTNLLDLDKKIGKPGVGVKVLAAGIMHEFGHSMFYLKDEYGTTRQCIMHPQSRTTTFCISCEKELLERYNKWKFPPEAARAGWPAAHPKPAMAVQEE